MLRSIMLRRLIWFLVGLLPGGVLGIWFAGLPLSSWEKVAKIAPIRTAAVATVAALIAFAALLLQRNIEQKRVAIDFF
jgi:hypothetical protein